MPEPDLTPCPTCGAAGSGRFCAACGASRLTDGCRSCGAPFLTDDQYCTQCGAARVTVASRVPEPRLPWIVGGLLSIAAVIMVLAMAGTWGEPRAVAMANAGNPAAAGANPAAAGTTIPPDISNMTPRERFTRLSDRVTAAAEKGDSTTVIQFWPMAQQAYGMLLPGDRDIDARYHMATLELMISDFPATLAQADTILTEAPNNLMAFYLRSVVAEIQQDKAARTAADVAFVKHFETEMASGRSEYSDHDAMLRQFRGELP